MAKRTSRSKKKKEYPIQRKFPLVIDGSPDLNAMIRVDRALSAINHRLYRQSRMYTVKVDLNPSVPEGTFVNIWALVDTWWLHKAYRLAYDTFMENSKEEREQMGTMGARWNDFRVNSGLGTTFQKDLLPSGNTDPTGTPSIYGTGGNQEYLFSEAHTPAGTRTEFHFSGAIAGAWNIIDQYDVTGNTDDDPSTPTTAVAYDGLTDEIDGDQMEHLSADGNLPPYNTDTLENYVWVKVGTLTKAHSGGATQKFSTGFFKAPYGMIACSGNANFTGTNNLIDLEVKAGDYKGVHATNCLE